MMEDGMRRRRPIAKQQNKGVLFALLLLLFCGGSVHSELATTRNSTTRAMRETRTTRATSEITEITDEPSQQPATKNEFSTSMPYPYLGSSRLNNGPLSETLDSRTSEAAAAAAAAAAAFAQKKTQVVSTLENTIEPASPIVYNGIYEFTPSGYLDRSDTTSASDNSTTTKRPPSSSTPVATLSREKQAAAVAAAERKHQYLVTEAERNPTEARTETSRSTLPSDSSSALPRAASPTSPIDDTTRLRMSNTEESDLSPSSSSSPSLSSDSYRVDKVGWSSERNTISPRYEQSPPELSVSSFGSTESSADSNNTESSGGFSIPPVRENATTTTTTTTTTSTTEVSAIESTGAITITGSPTETTSGAGSSDATTSVQTTMMMTTSSNVPDATFVTKVTTEVYEVETTAVATVTDSPTETTSDATTFAETTTMTVSSDIPDATLVTEVTTTTTTRTTKNDDVATMDAESESTQLADTETTSGEVISSTMEITSEPTVLVTTDETREDATVSSTSETRADYFSTEQTTAESMDYSTEERNTRWESTTAGPVVYRNILAPSELTLLVKITFEGNWPEVCPHLPALRHSLGDLLTLSLKKNVPAARIMFHEDPCADERPSITLESSATASLLLYVVDKDGNLDVETTKLVPRLLHETRSASGPRITIRSFQLVQNATTTTTTTTTTTATTATAAAAADSSNAVAVIVVSCVALVCLALLAVLLFVVTSRRTRFNYGERCRPVSLDAYSLDNVSAYSSVRAGQKAAAAAAAAAAVAAAATALRASKRSYGNPGFEDSTATPSHPLNFAGLSGFCKDRDKIMEEFAGIPQVTAGIDELPSGAEVKNRYANVIALPETRVPLARINDDPLSEYINASYVRGPKNATKYYIACQAPLESTVADFWRMIWEQRSKVVIMLTDLVENGVEKCSEYVPPSEITDCRRLFGDFQVTLKKRESKEKYAISSIRLKNLDKDTFREISHIWYPWPTAEAATQRTETGAALIAVLLEARALQRGGPAPVVVHCSPGTGRTGTLIALDLAIRQYEITRTVDVPRVVYTIRRDRAGAVRTNEQYALVYEALNLYASRLAGGASDS